MSSMKIKKGDTVRVIAGKDKDKEGKVLAVNKKDRLFYHSGSDRSRHIYVCGSSNQR